MNPTTDLDADTIEDIITETVLNDHSEGRLLRRIRTAANDLSLIDDRAIRLAARVEHLTTQVRFDVEAGRPAYDHFSQAASELTEALGERRVGTKMLRSMVKSVDDELLRDQLLNLIDG